jgi:hypothetical protein
MATIYTLKPEMGQQSAMYIVDNHFLFELYQVNGGIIGILQSQTFKLIPIGLVARQNIPYLMLSQEEFQPMAIRAI